MRCARFYLVSCKSKMMLFLRSARKLRCGGFFLIFEFLKDVWYGLLDGGLRTIWVGFWLNIKKIYCDLLEVEASKILGMFLKYEKFFFRCILLEIEVHRIPLWSAKGSSWFFTMRSFRSWDAQDSTLVLAIPKWCYFSSQLEIEVRRILFGFWDF